MGIDAWFPPQNDDLARPHGLGLEDDVFDLFPRKLVAALYPVWDIAVGATEITDTAEFDLHGEQAVGGDCLADFLLGKLKIVYLHGVSVWVPVLVGRWKMGIVPMKKMCEN
jgi:hypothetical protein